MSDYEHKDQRTPDPEEMRLQREEIEAHLKEEPQAEKPLAATLQEQYPWANQPLNTAYLKRLEQKLATQAEIQKAHHRPKSSPAYHPETPTLRPREVPFIPDEQDPTQPDLLAMAMLAMTLPPEDQPTPDEPQPVIDFPTGKGGPDENRYAGLITSEKDLDLAVTRVYLRGKHIRERLEHLFKLLDEAEVHNDWGRIATAKDGVKLLLELLPKEEVAQWVLPKEGGAR